MNIDEENYQLDYDEEKHHMRNRPILIFSKMNILLQIDILLSHGVR